MRPVIKKEFSFEGRGDAQIRRALPKNLIDAQKIYINMEDSTDKIVVQCCQLECELVLLIHMLQLT